MNKNTQTKYNEIVDNIIQDLEAGVIPWHKPWKDGNTVDVSIVPRRHNGERYRGINVIILWNEKDQKGFFSPNWFTFNQAKAVGGRVKKGEIASTIFYWDVFKTKKKNENGEEEEKEIPFVKYYSVFNTEQIEELPEEFYCCKKLDELETRPPEEHLSFFLQTGAEIRHGGSRAFYRSDIDYIQLPDFETFENHKHYFSTLAHEAIHWTGHSSRLDRKSRYHDHKEAYAFEELVAELGAAFLSAELGLCPTLQSDHASYIENWIKVFKKNKRALLSAASQAQKAVEYLKSLQPE